MRTTATNVFLSALALGSGLVEGARLPRRADAPTVVTTTVTEAAAPTGPSASDWAAGATRDVPIHNSCNATQRALLSRGFDDAMRLAGHARDHVLRFGNSSDFYTKYFGSAATAEVVGWYDRIVYGDKGGMWFRCDDIDGNCQQDGWAGHWRGENATHETVICPLSFTTRQPLEGMCGYGYQVATGKLAFYFGSDLIHRLLHVPSIGEGAAEHYADSYQECLDLAVSDPSQAVRNSHSLQYFALDVYAYDIALPGEGCTGRPSEDEEEESAPTPTSTDAADAPSKTEDAPTECHTHDDGVVHCS